MSYLPTIIAAVVAVLGVFAPQVQDLVTAHPAIAAVVAGIGAIIAHLLPSPRQQ